MVFDWGGEQLGKESDCSKSGVYRVIRYGTMIVYMLDLMDLLDDWGGRDHFLQFRFETKQKQISEQGLDLNRS